jgi:hypothetical protein
VFGGLAGWYTRQLVMTRPVPPNVRRGKPRPVPADTRRAGALTRSAPHAISVRVPPRRYCAQPCTT